MNNPLVTIIVPVYNCEAYLDKCIENILAQTYENLQIVIINDGSTDSSLAVCQKVSDDRVEVYSKPNGGASSARNFGLRYRRGKYVLFVDSDDYLAENAVEILVDKAEKTNADCIYYEADNITEDSNLKIKKNGLNQTVQYPDSDGNTLIEALLKNKNYHAVPFLYFTNSSLYDRGLAFVEGIMFEDELFSFELLRMCDKVVCLKKILYYRNVRPDSVMTSTGKGDFRFHSITVVMEKLYEQFAKFKDDTVFKMYIARIAMLWLDYYNQLSADGRIKAKPKYTEIKQIILENKGFGNRELVIRCYSEKLWLAYIAPGKICKRLTRKLKYE